MSSSALAPNPTEWRLTKTRPYAHQRNVVDIMQTRMELYDRIGYHDYEARLDSVFAAAKK